MYWFLEDFLPSFLYAKRKKLTVKQAAIFEKYMDELHNYRYKKTSLGSIEVGSWNNKKVIFEKEVKPNLYEYSYYVTIQ